VEGKLIALQIAGVCVSRDYIVMYHDAVWRQETMAGVSDSKLQWRAESVSGFWRTHPFSARSLVQLLATILPDHARGWHWRSFISYETRWSILIRAITNLAHHTPAVDLLSQQSSGIVSAPFSTFPASFSRAVAGLSSTTFTCLPSPPTVLSRIQRLPRSDQQLWRSAFLQRAPPSPLLQTP